MKSATLLLFLIVFNFSFYSQTITKEISGTVTSYLNEPLNDVNIIIQGTIKGTKTNVNGEYNLQANTGDIIEYSFVGYKTVLILVEDITNELNIKMEANITELDEVVIEPTTKSNSTRMDFNSKIYMSNGSSINPMSLKGVKQYSPGKIQKQYLLLSDGLKFNYPDSLPSNNFDLDGDFFKGEPKVDLSSILNVYYIPDALSYYPVFLSPNDKSIIIIRTTNSKEYKEQVGEKFKNQNFYSDDAVTTTNENTFSSSNITTSLPNVKNTKTIHGKVTFSEAPLALVNVIVVGKYTGVKTDSNGEFSIQANVNDIIQFSYMGLATVSVIVEDITDELNIEMVENRNELDEITVIANGKEGKAAEMAKKREEKFATGMGNIDPKIAGFAVSYIDGDDITPGARDLLDVINGKVSGVTVNQVTREVKLRGTNSILNEVPPIWDVDNSIFNYIPEVDPVNIKAIYILKSLASTARYGGQGRGGVIVVKTRSGNFSATNDKTNKIAEQYTNKDFYANDASQIALSSLNSNSYADALEAFETKQKAYIYYDEQLKNQLPSFVDHIAIAQKFASFYKDINLSAQIFNDLMERYSDDPEIMKAIAYNLQTIGKHNETIDAYQRTFKLRPEYAQSYRDLANAYMENDLFEKSWRLYMSYLIQGKTVNDEGIGQLIFNEMEWLYFYRNDRIDIKRNFVPKSEKLSDFKNDVRLVFEWNTSEAEFNLEFVNPELRSYVFEHTLAGNQELITDEKQKGYSSKEFFIEDLKDGEWLVNITYKGNKKTQPTYFKITKYLNWGTKTQTKEVEVYKFQNERDKIQLLNLNKQILLSNK